MQKCSSANIISDLYELVHEGVDQNDDCLAQESHKKLLPRKGITLLACSMVCNRSWHLRGNPISWCDTLPALQKKGDVWICLWVPCVYKIPGSSLDL